MTIGERLKIIRTDLRLSQAKFADELSIHLRSYVSYEQGHRSIPQTVMLQLLEKGYNIHWLLTGEGDMKSTGIMGDIGHPEYKVNESIPLIGDLSVAFAGNDLPIMTISAQKIDRPSGNKDPFLYAVKVGSFDDDSMVPFFSLDEIVIASPLDNVMNNDKAIIKLKDGRILFRVIQFHGGNIELMAANSQYPSINVLSSDILFLHKVVSSLSI